MQKKTVQNCDTTNNVVQKGYNTRLKVLKGKQELTSVEFGLFKCQTVTAKTCSDTVLRL